MIKENLHVTIYEHLNFIINKGINFIIKLNLGFMINEKFRDLMAIQISKYFWQLKNPKMSYRTNLPFQ